MNNKILKYLLIVLIIILLIALIAFLFMKFYPSFGSAPSLNDKKEYSKRADNYKGGKFYNNSDFKVLYANLEENHYVSKKKSKPIDEIPIVKPSFLNNPSIDTLSVTWLGHSSILMQMHGMNILVDPIFSKYSSPFSFVGPERFSKPPLSIDDLPNIDIVIISHDHYDHLDYNTIKKIDKKTSKYVVPLGVENHLEKWNVKKNKIINMAWWEEINIKGLTIGCMPARHHSGRRLFDRFSSLWASWVFEDEYHRVFESGDTGFDTHFNDIYNKYKEFDLALIDSGQYDTKWKSNHMVPEESVEAGKILNSKVIMPIHWGAFKLSNHPWDDGVERFTIKADEQDIKYITPKIGETVIYGKDMPSDKWWRDIN